MMYVCSMVSDLSNHDSCQLLHFCGLIYYIILLGASACAPDGSIVSSQIRTCGRNSLFGITTAYSYILLKIFNL